MLFSFCDILVFGILAEDTRLEFAFQLEQPAERSY